MNEPINIIYFYQNENPQQPLISLVPQDQRDGVNIINAVIHPLPDVCHFVCLPDSIEDLKRIKGSYSILPSLRDIKKFSEARELFTETLVRKKNITTSIDEPSSSLEEIDFSLNQKSYSSIILLLEKLKNKDVVLTLHDLNLTIGKDSDITYEELQFLLLLLSSFGNSIFSLVKSNDKVNND